MEQKKFFEMNNFTVIFAINSILSILLMLRKGNSSYLKAISKYKILYWSIINNICSWFEN